jgi:hypothetical protein
MMVDVRLSRFPIPSRPRARRLPIPCERLILDKRAKTKKATILLNTKDLPTSTLVQSVVNDYVVP